MGIILREHIHYSLRITENWYDLVHEERKNYFQKSSLSQIKPRFFKEERGKDYPCFRHTITENEVKIISDYFVGIDWLTNDKSRFIQVEPKLNDKVVESFEEATKKSDTFSDKEIEEFNGKVEEEIKNSSGKKEVDVIGMLMQIMSHAEVSKHTRNLLFVDWEDQEILINQKQDLLTPFLVVRFLNLLKHIVRKGLKKSYYKKQDNLRNRVKGKILVGQQIRQNVFKNRLTNTVCEYQVFGEDSLENRFLNKVFIFCTNYIENNKIYFKEENEIFWLINYIRPSFEHIGSEINIQDIKNYKHNPFFKEYKEAINIGQQILKRFSYNITKTTEEEIFTPPFWIDMPKMFELYVYAQLLKDNPELQAKDFNYQFSTYGNALDFLICSDKKKIVVDAKYKLHYNYSQVHNDIRQVAGYARLKKVKNQSPQLNEEIECLIIYPKPIGNITNEELQLDKLLNDEIKAYHKVYKIGINLPVIEQNELK